MLFLDFWYCFTLQIKYQLTFFKLFLVNCLMLKIGTFQYNNLCKIPLWIISMLCCWQKHKWKTHTYLQKFPCRTKWKWPGWPKTYQVDLMLEVIFLFWDETLEFGIFLLVNSDVWIFLLFEIAILPLLKKQT